MKKIIALLLAMIMVCGLATASFAAENQDAEYTKVYTATNDGSTSPAETFTFKYTAVSAKDASTGADLKNATGEDVTCPEIKDSTVTFATGEATTAGAEKAITVPLKDVKWPYVGVYTYKVEETVGNTAGVTYDSETRYLKVTVAYDAGTNTYYTAFVTLELVDADKDGITDGEKTDKIENEYSAGSLSINKQVTGNMGDQEKEFTVKVTFTAPDGLVVKSDIKYSDANKAGTVDGLIEAGESGWTGTKDVTIKLKHDETVTFTNIPYGVTYTVEEDNYSGDGYDAPLYQYQTKVGGVTLWIADDNEPDTIIIGGDTIVFDSAKIAELREVDTAKENVMLTNNKDVDVDTGVALDSAPYFLMLAVAVIGMVALVSKKRYEV